MSSSGASRDPGTGAAPDTPRTSDDKDAGERATDVNVEPGSPSGERTSRKERAERRSTGQDTLLSAPAPAASFEIEVDDRLSSLERDTEDIKHRLTTIEAKLEAARKPPTLAQNWLVWVVFLLALAVGYQLLFRGR